jgi:hypothetical protein
MGASVFYRKSSFLLVCFFLAACGNSPKLDPLADGGKKQKPSGPCEADYNPISLFLPGSQPLADPENLPAGTYVNNGMEFYAFDDQRPLGVQQVHFQEIFFGDSGAIRSVCHTVIDPQGSAEYECPALRTLTITKVGAKSRQDAIYQIQNTRGKFVAGIVVNPVLAPTGLSALMAKFTSARLYKTGLTSYELHGELSTTTLTGVVSKWVLQRIQFLPPESI